MVAFELEVIGYTIALAYCLHKGLPFSAYGELAFLLVQGTFMSKIYGNFLSHCIKFSILLSAQGVDGCLGGVLCIYVFFFFLYGAFPEYI